MSNTLAFIILIFILGFAFYILILFILREKNVLFVKLKSKFFEIEVRFKDDKKEKKNK